MHVTKTCMLHFPIMTADHQKHAAKLFTAELQFRLASAVNIAVTLKTQPLDLPKVWTHGKLRMLSPRANLSDAKRIP
jgi:hypothetical protein